MTWYTRILEEAKTASMSHGEKREEASGVGGKYYDSKQQETVMDRRERAQGPRAAFLLYKSPPVLRY